MKCMSCYSDNVCTAEYSDRIVNKCTRCGQIYNTVRLLDIFDTKNKGIKIWPLHARNLPDSGKGKGGDMNCKEIIEEKLKELGAEGLQGEYNCGCGIGDDFMPCGESCEECEPAYRIKARCMNCDNEECDSNNDPENKDCFTTDREKALKEREEAEKARE